MQAPESRLTWPALLEHPFVKETSDDPEARVAILNFYVKQFQNMQDAH